MPSIKKTKPDTVELSGATAPGPSNKIIFQTLGKRVFLDRRLIEIHEDGTVTMPRRYAKETGLI